MSRRRREMAHQEPSLVPLADMLTNTVGIILFILIFTVLATGASTVLRRLPIEHESNLQPLFFITAGNRIYPTELGTAKDDFFEGSDSITINKLISELDKPRETEEFTITLEGWSGGSGLSIAMMFKPKPGAGETLTQMNSPTSAFVESLSEFDPEEHFVFFFVQGDSIEAFVAARSLAQTFGFPTGWSPTTAESPMGLMLVGTGEKARVL